MTLTSPLCLACGGRGRVKTRIGNWPYCETCGGSGVCDDQCKPLTLEEIPEWRTGRLSVSRQEFGRLLALLGQIHQWHEDGCPIDTQLEMASRSAREVIRDSWEATA